MFRYVEIKAGVPSIFKQKALTSTNNDYEVKLE